jgi:hypothetical protein
MDQLQGVRVLIDRLGLPPRLAYLVAEMERQDGPLNEVGETPGALEVRRILGMVDGQNLCAAIVACLCNHVPADELEGELRLDAIEQDTRTPYTRWLDAVAMFPDPIVLLLSNGNYVAFDSQATRLADAIEEHHLNLDGKVAVALSANTAPSWAAKIERSGLDVLLVHEDEDGGYITITPDEAVPPEEVPTIEA